MLLGDMVKCELQLQLRVGPSLPVAGCTYCASYELLVKRELRVGNSKIRVKAKIARCLFSVERRPFLPNEEAFRIQFATFLRVSFHKKSF